MDLETWTYTCKKRGFFNKIKEEDIEKIKSVILDISKGATIDIDDPKIMDNTIMITLRSTHEACLEISQDLADRIRFSVDAERIE